MKRTIEDVQKYIKAQIREWKKTRADLRLDANAMRPKVNRWIECNIMSLTQLITMFRFIDAMIDETKNEPREG